ncbi:hypothetical protein B0H17DRAFT_302110 [Mycena rosella]|uniref:DUF6534 domain-containing protein n=1 Tax=Mycena rosella TaxID=1033263 RepID=A0AAD7CVM3_MYCRO|nr:hypothetical protein B0H17DRAFT_302110 [Mycena rosella]
MDPMNPAPAYGPAEVAHGPIFIGFFFNALLYGIMVNQTYFYFSTFRVDRLWTRAFVACIFALDTANTVFDLAYLYDCLIVHFDDVPYLARATWLFATDPAMTAIIAFLVQVFYVWRVRVLTGSASLAALIFACALAGLAGGLATTVEVLREPEFRDFIRFKSVVILWLLAECLADILIATLLVRHLRAHKSGMPGSDALVDRVIRLTVQTGIATALCATIDLIVFLSDPIGLHLTFNFPLCKLYTNALLSSLNGRGGSWGGAAGSGSGRTGLMTSKRASASLPVRSSYFPHFLISSFPIHRLFPIRLLSA